MQNVSLVMLEKTVVVTRIMLEILLKAAMSEILAAHLHAAPILTAMKIRMETLSAVADLDTKEIRPPVEDARQSVQTTSTVRLLEHALDRSVSTHAQDRVVSLRFALCRTTIPSAAVLLDSSVIHFLDVHSVHQPLNPREIPAIHLRVVLMLSVLSEEADRSAHASGTTKGILKSGADRNVSKTRTVRRGRLVSTQNVGTPVLERVE
jgi:hypothetical protein